MRARSLIGYIDTNELEKLATDFNRLGQEGKNKLAKINRDGIIPVYKSARRKVVVRTGKLKRSIIIKQYKTNRNTKTVFGVRPSGVRYGFMVETGTIKMEARPYLRPAIDENQSKIVDIIGNGISQLIKDVL